MAHDHHHHHAHATDDRRSLSIALGLIGTLLVAEVFAGLLAGSLALLADAGHMLADVLALAGALWAAQLARRPAGGRWTFGLSRAEVLAAQVNGLTLLLVGAWIVYGAIRRLIAPTEVHGGIVVVVALAAIAVNAAAAVALMGGRRRSLNVRAAFLHVATDMAAFAGTAVAGGLILVTGWNRFDPIASLFVAGLCFWSAVSLLRESTRIFLEGSPGEIDPVEVGRAIVAQDGVVEAHDLHVWTVTSGFTALSAHVLVEPERDCHALRHTLERVLEERFGLSHTTLQVDHATSGSQTVVLGETLPRRGPLPRN
ncbi:MAG: cobalt-zinc-cadmium efflux system protein [Gaiellaceae bacterium]|nr:cobalt-zinc-cadmium efflux system protein [Gaiellaceae bacterium]